MNPNPTTLERDGERMIVNLGPSHPATHGTLRIIMELDGEFIAKATPEIG
jgi:NADH:ubiquinone oxidoreductase subunit D